MTIAGFEKPRILIVEDNPTNARMLARALQNDYKISLAASGLEALSIVNSEDNRPDLMLLDIVLPGMSGHQVCAQLKENPALRNIPVIFISSKDSVEDEERGLDLGAVDYITKPFNLPIVKARVRTQLELKRHRDYFEKLSHHDGLTGVANRRRFDEVATTEWRRACRTSEYLSVLMLDIDYFKKFNDGYGHTSGDQCLRRVARTLSENTRRAADFLARYGGEEFVVLLPQTDTLAGVEVGHKMHRAVADLALPHRFSPLEVVTVSVGVASARAHKEASLTELLKHADQALYQAKHLGRNQVVAYNPNDSVKEPLTEGVQLRRLRRAVASRHLSASDWKMLTSILEDLALSGRYTGERESID